MAVHREALAAGADDAEALKAVVDALIADTLAPPAPESPEGGIP